MFTLVPLTCLYLNCNHQNDDVGKAHPRIVEAVETMLKKGKWTVPGAYIRFNYFSCLHVYRIQGEVRRSQSHVICHCLLERILSSWSSKVNDIQYLNIAVRLKHRILFVNKDNKRGILLGLLDYHAPNTLQVVPSTLSMAH